MHALPSYLRTAMRLALLTGSLAACGTSAYPDDAAPDADPCAGPVEGGPCRFTNATCPDPRIEGPTLCHLVCAEPFLQPRRWERGSCARGPLPPPEGPA